MSTDTVRAGGRVAELRTAFDATFARPPAVVSEQFEDLLAIRVGETPYALRVAELSALHAGKAVTPIPGSPAELLGVAGFRGAIVAVYDLRALLGEVIAGPCGWLVLAAPDSRVGFAFNAFESHFRVSRAAIAAEQPDRAGTPGREAVQAAGVIRPIVQVSILRDGVQERLGAQQKER